MPPRPSTSITGLSNENIVDGSRKRLRNDDSSSTTSPLMATNLPLTGVESRPAVNDERLQVMTQGFRLLDYIFNRIDPSDKGPLCIPFMALPTRSEYPDYYQQIKMPLSLEQIRRRLLAGRYESLEEVRNALETVWRNAKRFNLKASPIYEQARILHSATRESYVELVESNRLAPAQDGAPLESDPPLMQQSLMLAKLESLDARARLDYDEEEGQDLAIVSLRLKRPDDMDYDEDEEAALPVYAPAMVATPNGVGMGVKAEPKGNGRQSEPDDTEMVDVMAPDASSGAVNGNEENLAPSAAATTAAAAASTTAAAAKQSDTPSAAGTPADRADGLDGSDGENEEEAVELKDMAGYDVATGLLHGKPLDKSMLTKFGTFDRRKRSGPRGKRLKSSLRHQVTELKSLTTKDGSLLCADFMELPSRRAFPVYFQEIARPISLGMIDEKAMRNGYRNPHELMEDLTLMVANAKQFNEPNSNIWNTADTIGKHIEAVVIPSLLADGFSMDPEDVRQSALPIEYAAASSIPAHAAAYKRTTKGDDQSASPEPSLSGLRARVGTRDAASGSPKLPGGLGQSMSPAHGMPYSGGVPRFPVNGGQHPAGPQAYSISPQQQQHLSPMPGQMHAHGRPPMGGHAPQGYPFPHPRSYGGSPVPARGQYPTTGAGMLPFQRPLQSMMAPGTPPVQAPVRMLRRMTGEAPPDPYEVMTSILLPNGKPLQRKPVAPYFVVSSTTAIAQQEKSIELLNDLTRIHAVNLGRGADTAAVRGGTDERVTLSFRLREIVPTTPHEQNADGGSRDESPVTWQVSARYNGQLVSIEHASLTEEDATTGATKLKGANGSPTISANRGGGTLTSVPQGSTCHFSVCPTMGGSVVEIVITPGAPDAALMEIASDAKNVFCSRARAYCQLPDKYRIFLHRA